ncbi:uncharacterized protein I206_106304 [Kwoniella pini CBS 10737]|uniref:Glycosyl transferase CAP10 domain-containing protein n=1 Tax=Kwoniella pini CBS 10737 TaxID=1296096 RepID=A0A1B9HTY3_9TREE|nr:uncharacterized protein I206_07106 [Kwoniella pini CBS 10737]OCF46719.1 hypothetical protein I206_07106 [Kwoniella pini CBS 10737]
MSLRPHTYITSSLTPPTYSQSFPSRPRLPSIAEDRHHAQLATYKKTSSRSANSIRQANLLSVWASNPHMKKSEDELEDGDEQSKLKRKRWILLSGIGLVKSVSHHRRWLLYAIGLFLVYLTCLRPLLTNQHDNNQIQNFHPEQRSSPSPISIKRSSSRSALPRAPLPPAILAKRSLEHKVAEDGLLKVNPKSTVHPIHQLIRDAREGWDKKVNRQSKTLLEATQEYQRRYARKPPKGFDLWWNYVVDNDIPLPDEYDQIHKDLLPFQALSSKDLNNRIKQASQLPDTYTLRIKRGSIRTNIFYSSDIHGADERLEQQTELLKPIAKFLPDLQAIWSVHDTPRTIISWDYRRELAEHVEDGEWFDEEEEIDLTLSGWSSACPPRSPIKSIDSLSSISNWMPNTSLSHKAFISSHSKSMDLCSHPDMIPIHGAVAGKSPRANHLTPIFTLSKTALHADILGVPVEQWTKGPSIDIPFEDKKIDRLLWRGSNTGTEYNVETPWRNSHRTRLISLTNFADQEDTEDNLGIDYIPPPKAMRMKTPLEKLVKKGNLGDWNDNTMDLAFTGGPIQCNVDDGTCDDLMADFAWADQMTHEDEGNYKYIIDVDGNAWSARFKRLLTSGSLVLKATIMPEWWNDRIQPWVHYVPIQMDYSDLYDVMAFFQGLPSMPGESALARDIANAGKNWSLTHWRKEDMIAYMFRLYLEWGRLVADQRISMNFEYDEDMERRRDREAVDQ